ncbi:MAG: serine/threonine protein kinase [Planctomycetes bacterium]|nr:serine/threonine protein kinase [Planctomycetota bacterium]
MFGKKQDTKSKQVEHQTGWQLWDYKIIGEIYRGSVSTVCRAMTPDQRMVAIKFLNVDQSNVREARKHFQREVYLTAMMKHERLIKVVDYYPEDHQPAIVMEYFDNKNLKQRILHKDPALKQYGLKIMRDCLEGLGYIHGQLGYVHRDIKPENILVSEQGEARIVDFTIAAKVGGVSFGLRKIAGTRLYIAPETIQRKAPTFPTDLYSLGCTFYEMIAMRPPFVGEDMTTILTKHLHEAPVQLKHFAPTIDSEADKLILQMLAKKPESRPESCQACLSRLVKVKALYTEAPATA